MAGENVLDVLTVRIEGDIKQLRQAMAEAGMVTEQGGRKIKSSMDSADQAVARVGRTLRNALGAVGLGFGIAQVVQFGAAAIKAAGGIGEMAESIGLSNKEFQQLQYGAAQAGVETNKFTQGMGFFARRVAEAANGSDDAIKAFRELGKSSGMAVGVLDASGKQRAVVDVFNDVAEAISRIKDPAEQVRMRIELFSRAGLAMGPMLSKGKAGLDEFRDSADRMGAVLSDERVKKADDFGDALARMGATAKIAAVELADLLGILGAPQWLERKTIEEINRLRQTGGWSFLGMSGPGDTPQGLRVDNNRIDNAVSARGAMLGRGSAIAAMTGESAGVATSTMGGKLPPSESESKARASIKRAIDDAKAEAELASQSDRQREIGNKVRAVENQLIEAKVKMLPKERAELSAALGLAYDANKARESSIQTMKIASDQEMRDLQQLEQLDKEMRDWTAATVTQTNEMSRQTKENEQLLKALQEGELAYSKLKDELAAIAELKKNNPLATDEEIARVRKLSNQLSEQDVQMDRIRTSQANLKEAALALGDAFGTAFESAIFRGEGLRETLSALLMDIQQIIFRLLVTKQIEAAIGAQFGGGGAGFGALLGGLGKFLGIGGGGSAALAPGTPGLAAYTMGPMAAKGAIALPFQSGGAVLTQPMDFPVYGTKGGGRMGEAGPESIMPLATLPDGSLGIRAVGGSGGGKGDMIYIDARGATPGVLEEIKRGMAKLDRSIEPRSIQAVTAARARDPRLFATALR